MNTLTPRISARTSFGIDENAGNPIIVRATRTGRSASFARATLADLASPHPRDAVAACLFQRESFIRWLETPIASPRKAGTVLHSLLDIQLPFAVEDCEIAILEINALPGRTGTRGLVAGARSTDIAKRLDGLASTGLDPHILDQEAVALWSLCNAEFPPVKGASCARVVVYLGSDRITFASGRDGEFVAAHTMRQADPDAIHRLLKSSFPSQPETTQWIWAGPGAMNPDTVMSLHSALATRWPGGMNIVTEPETFLARALARRALVAGADRCNLRTGRFLHPLLIRQNQRRPYQWAIACFAAGLLLCLVNTVWLTAWHHRMAESQKALRTLAAGVMGSPYGIQAGQEVLTARRALDAQTKDMEPFLAGTEAPAKNTLALILSAARDEGVSIETMTLSLTHGVIHGLASKLAQGDRMALQIAHHGWTTTIERKESAPGDDRTAFVIAIGQPSGK